jgi:glycyl-tRNA synthetase beta chain
VKQVLHMPEFLAIGAACKRVRNILRQAEEKGVTLAARFEYFPDSAPEEKNLAAYIEVNGPRVEEHRKKKEYGDALMLLSTSRERVDAFFDKVMVMVEDPKLRANRLALLRALLKEFSTIADFFRDRDGEQEYGHLRSLRGLKPTLGCAAYPQR